MLGYMKCVCYVPGTAKRFDECQLFVSGVSHLQFPNKEVGSLSFVINIQDH